MFGGEGRVVFCAVLISADCRNRGFVTHMILTVDGLAYRKILQDISFSASEGEIIGLVGANGAGTSTLLRCLASVFEYDGGKVTLCGKPFHDYSPQARAKRIAYIPQATEVMWPLTAEEVVALGRVPYNAVPHALKGADLEAREKALAICDLIALRDRSYRALSGGERARANLARALTTETPILLADEPLAGLDPKYQLRFLEIIKDLARAGKMIILALHDLTHAINYCDKILILKAGKRAAFDTPDRLLQGGAFNQAFETEFALYRNGEKIALHPEIG